MPADGRESLVASLVELVEGSIVAERDRCVRACRRRSDLWRRTALSRSPSASAREESRSRADEAAYLADLIDGGGRLLGEPDTDVPDA
jgi:hypothetical protein